MTTRAEEIAAEEYPPITDRIERAKMVEMTANDLTGWERAAFAKGYKQGQQNRWIPVAMIHNDYDASVRCSNCGDTGGFGVYDDLEWAKHCPGCGRPISEQVSAKGLRTPHPLYVAPNPEQR